MEELIVGTELYHKTEKIKCVVNEITDDKIKIIIERITGNKYEIALDRSCLGEELFFSKEHIDMGVDELLNIVEYWESPKFDAYFQSLSLPKRYELRHKIVQKRNEIKPYRNVIESRQIKKLIHFTRVENLLKILNEGIKSREILNQYTLEDFFYGNIPKYNDSNRFDGKTDCSCFSVEFPNAKVLTTFKNNIENSRWVIFFIDPTVILDKYKQVYFCWHNAATSSIIPFLRGTSLNTPEAFEYMFSDEINYRRSDRIVRTEKRDLILNKYRMLPTSEQAEILIKGIVDKKYICKVVFSDKTTLAECNMNPEIKRVLENYNVEVMPLYFNSREEFIKKMEDEGWHQECFF